MGNCASSKYAVDEDKKPKREKLNKKQKKEASEEPNAQPPADSPPQPDTKAEPEPAAQVPNADKEDIDFIDKKEEAPAPTTKCADTSSTSTESKLDDNQKKEVTTYQTTVVKHSQKEGDELMNHLKDEAFRTLQNALNKQEKSASPAHQPTTVTTTTASSNDAEPETTQSPDNDDILQQIKAQALISLGNNKQEAVFQIIENGASLIKENKVKSMNELMTALEAEHPEDHELVGKVINSTTGFLTAKGTEAGALLSNILANVSTGLQGVMNETEKTTVKVTRTVTEQVMQGGQLKEVTRVVTSDQPMPGATSNIEEVLKNLQSGLNVDGTTFTTTTTASAPEVTRTKVVNSGTTETSSSHAEKHENFHQQSSASTEADSLTRNQAENVVTTVVKAAVEKLSEESSSTAQLDAAPNAAPNANGVMQTTFQETDLHEHVTEENIKIEEESSVKTSTTKIVLNGEESVSSQIEKVQSEFYKHGKQSAEESINKLNINGDESVKQQSASQSKHQEEATSTKETLATSS